MQCKIFNALMCIFFLHNNHFYSLLIAIKINIYFKALDINKIRKPIIIPISFGIFFSFSFFLIVVNILPTIIKVSAEQRIILLKTEPMIRPVIKTIARGILTNNAAIRYNMELNLLVLI